MPVEEYTRNRQVGTADAPSYYSGPTALAPTTVTSANVTASALPTTLSSYQKLMQPFDIKTNPDAPDTRDFSDGSAYGTNTDYKDGGYDTSDPRMQAIEAEMQKSNEAAYKMQLAVNKYLYDQHYDLHWQ